MRDDLKRKLKKVLNKIGYRLKQVDYTDQQSVINMLQRFREIVQKETLRLKAYENALKTLDNGYRKHLFQTIPPVYAWKIPALVRTNDQRLLLATEIEFQIAGISILKNVAHNLRLTV